MNIESNAGLGSVGMYAVSDPAYPKIHVGGFTICRHDATTVWIQDENEGAQFQDSEFELAIRAFFDAHF